MPDLKIIDEYGPIPPGLWRGPTSDYEALRGANIKRARKNVHRLYIKSRGGYGRIPTNA